MTVAVVVPVHRNPTTLAELVDRLDGALADREWRVRFVVDACPAGSAAVAHGIAAHDPRVAVTELVANVGQHAALRHGLGAEVDATAWACLDADLQDPPEALPSLLDRLSDHDVVFAGRRGAYESPGRRLTGRAHRLAVSVLTGLPSDAGAFVVLGPQAHAALRSPRAETAPSVVVALGPRLRPGAGLRVVSVPVPRAVRPAGSSAWSSTARLRQSLRTLAWCAHQRTHR